MRSQNSSPYLNSFHLFGSSGGGCVTLCFTHQHVDLRRRFCDAENAAEIKMFGETLHRIYSNIPASDGSLMGILL